jgi:hypothetical protein
MRRHPVWAWFGFLAYAAAATFPHETVQYYVDQIARRITHRGLYQASAAIALLLGVLFTIVLLLHSRKRAGRHWINASWVLTIGLIFGAWGTLTANNTELVHYPQYLPEGVALLAMTLSVTESMAWIAIFGGLDECFQYWHLMGGKPVPYDFNDVCMDVLGGATGVVLAMAILRWEPSKVPTPWKRILTRPGVLVVIFLLIAGIVLWSFGLMVLYADGTHYWFALSRVKFPTFWFQVVANGPNRYHTLSPVEGPILILAVIGLYSILDRRLRLSGAAPNGEPDGKPVQSTRFPS